MHKEGSILNLNGALIQGRLEGKIPVCFFGRPVQRNLTNGGFYGLSPSATIDDFIGIIALNEGQKPISGNQLDVPNPKEDQYFLPLNSYGSVVLVRCIGKLPQNGGSVYVRPATNVFECVDNEFNFLAPNLSWGKILDEGKGICELIIMGQPNG